MPRFTFLSMIVASIAGAASAAGKTSAKTAFDVRIENAFDFLSEEYAALFDGSAATAFQHPLWLDGVYGNLVPRLGARPLTERLARDLQALGAQAERRLGRLAADQARHAGLTRRELDVLRLVATGRTDREIARELFLSHRTVEHHVRAIRLKLDCRSRTEAARRAVELGLLTNAART